jgi:hypothetical protein
MHRRNFLKNSGILSIGAMSGFGLIFQNCVGTVAAEGLVIIVEFLIEQGMTAGIDACIEGVIGDTELAGIVENSFGFFVDGIEKDGTGSYFNWSLRKAIIGEVKSQIADATKKYILSFKGISYDQGLTIYQHLTPSENENTYKGNTIKYSNGIGIYPAAANTRLTPCDCEKLRTYSSHDLEIITYEILARQGFDIPSDNIYFNIFNTGFNSLWYHQIPKLYHRYDATKNNLIGYPKNNYQIVQAVINKSVIRNIWMRELPPYQPIPQHLLQQQQLQKRQAQEHLQLQQNQQRETQQRQMQEQNRQRENQQYQERQRQVQEQNQQRENQQYQERQRQVQEQNQQRQNQEYQERQRQVQEQNQQRQNQEYQERQRQVQEQNQQRQNQQYQERQRQVQEQNQQRQNQQYQERQRQVQEQNQQRQNQQRQQQQRPNQQQFQQRQYQLRQPQQTRPQFQGPTYPANRIH